MNLTTTELISALLLILPFLYLRFKARGGKYTYFRASVEHDEAHAYGDGQVRLGRDEEDDMARERRHCRPRAAEGRADQWGGIDRDEVEIEEVE